MALKGDYKEFGEFVKDLRKERKLKQGDCSEKLGAKYNLMLDIEVGVRKPSLSLINKLAKLFEVDAKTMHKFLPEKKEQSDSKKKEKGLYAGIGERLKEVRLSRDESLTEAAQVIGVQRDHYYQMENGVTKPNLIHVRQLAEYFFHQYPLEKAVMYILYGEPLGKTKALIKKEELEYKQLKYRFEKLSPELKQAILAEEESREKANVE